MSEIYNDPNWNREASRLAEKLDHNDVFGHYGAYESMQRDLAQLHHDPHAQHQFVNMVNRMDHKGYGADLNVFRGPDGRETWQIMPYNYQDGYPGPRPMPLPPEMPVPVPMPMPMPIPGRPNPGEILIDGVAAGAGAVIGSTIMRNILHGGDNHHRR
jgi:hypothetical protein